MEENPTPRAQANWILSALSDADLADLLPHLELVQFEPDVIFFREHQPIEHIYFPCHGLIAHLALAASGESMAVSMVGHEGLLGGFSLWSPTLPYRALAMVGDHAYRITRLAMQPLMGRLPTMRRAILTFMHGLHTQLVYTAMCGRFHSIEERLARVFLLANDFLEERELVITQEQLGAVAGADRATIARSLGGMVKKELIEVRRGAVTIGDRRALKTVVCECYWIIHASYAAVLR